MNNLTSSINALREKILCGAAQDPLAFLESLMRGHDPRGLSAIYELVTSVSAQPTDIEWSEIVELVNARYKPRTVSISDSQSAANTLIKHLHPTPKSVESHVTSDVSVKLAPLTVDEIRNFRNVFDENF